MFEAKRGYGGAFTAPHHLAAEAGTEILRAGGNAVEAMVAAAATIAVVYPHMNAIGGDGFWLIRPGTAGPDAAPIAIDACGRAAAHASTAFYAAHGDAAIPTRGPRAALTVPGAVSGWMEALSVAADLGGTRPLPALLEAAIHHAETGVPATGGQVRLTLEKFAEIAAQPGFADVFLPGGQPPEPGQRITQPALARSLRHLAAFGLDDFYRGTLADRMAAELGSIGSPLARDDFARHTARRPHPLSVAVRHAAGGGARVYNHPPPTQGLASLMILGIFDRLAVSEADGVAYYHAIVEAVKQAFLVRDRLVTDPDRLPADPRAYLDEVALDKAAAAIDPHRALPWPQAARKGDTIWMGCIDSAGTAVSYIQSIYWEFGSAVVLSDTGVLMQNRGASFSLQSGHLNALEPGRKPFHTLNPALAVFKDGRVLSYGCMGGEGQPQTQAALFSRYARFGHDLQAAVTAPRWLLGRTWGAETTNLRIEGRVPTEVTNALAAMGHDVERVAEYTDVMGHAGGVARHADGLLEAAFDPRSDGAVGLF